MAWFRVDDKLHSAPKLLSIPRKHRLAALGLWTAAGSWSADHLTDGVIPDYMIEEWGGTKMLVDWLVKADLWQKTEDGTQFKNWDEYQPTKAAVEEDRKKNREKLQKWRERNRASNSDETEGVTGLQDGSKPEDNPAPYPTPPDPPPNTKEADASFVGPRRRATRISEDFMPTSDMIQWATAAAPGVDLRVETEKFINYWIAKSGKDATKLDWGRTWKNWILNSNGRGPGGGGNQQPRMDHGDRMTAKAESMIARMNGWDSNQQPAQLELGA